MPITTTQEKFIFQLGAIYDAEQQFLKGQAEMLSGATDPTLKQLIQQHSTETQAQVKNLETIFQAMGQKPSTERCEAAHGLVADGRKLMSEMKTPELRDCVIGAAATKIEHYEIAAYRDVVLGARMMGQQEVLQLLQQNLKQEERTAQLLEQSAPQLAEKAMAAEGAMATR